jgi:hypothetical protein
MNGEDEVDGKDVTELEQLTRLLEQSIQTSGFSGDRVSGNMEQGYIVSPSIEEEP